MTKRHEQWILDIYSKNKLTAGHNKNMTDLVKKARQGLPQTGRGKN